MASEVFFTNLRTDPDHHLLYKLEKLVRKAGINKIDFKDKFTAIKIHFGEIGNMAYLRPDYAAVIVKIIKDLGGKPFLTDCNTLYKGWRSNAIDHQDTAVKHGYTPFSVGTQVIIADGLKGLDYKEIPINGDYCKAPKIGAAIAEADIVVSLNHVKGHEMAGFGGALKNLGMGCGSAELVNAAPVIPNDNVLSHNREHHKHDHGDHWHMIHPDTNWRSCVEHAQKIGLGSMDYTLIMV